VHLWLDGNVWSRVSGMPLMHSPCGSSTTVPLVCPVCRQQQSVSCSACCCASGTWHACSCDLRSTPTFELCLVFSMLQALQPKSLCHRAVSVPCAAITMCGCCNDWTIPCFETSADGQHHTQLPHFLSCQWCGRQTDPSQIQWSQIQNVPAMGTLRNPQRPKPQCCTQYTPLPDFAHHV
jgi:hypothetical protein